MIRIFKSISILLPLIISIPCFAQEESSDLSNDGLIVDSCELLVSSDNAFGSINVEEYSPTPGPVDVGVKFQISNNQPCVVEKVTPFRMYFPANFQVQVSTKERGSKIRLFLNDKNGKPRGSIYDTTRGCATVFEDWEFMVGCSGVR